MESTAKTPFTVVVTGSTGGVGYAICTRLIEENIKAESDRPLVLVPTARNDDKATEAKRQLERHAIEFEARHRHSVCAKGLACPIAYDPIETGRIEILPGVLVLDRLESVKRFVDQLKSSRIQHVDVVIMNAGIGGWSGIDWFRCFYEMLFVDWISAVTYPTYKKAHEGMTISQSGRSTDGPFGKLGGVFCANVFGHYVLGHHLVPFLKRATDGWGRIVWVSSLEAYGSSLKVDDIQAIRSSEPYESSKRLTDMLVLSSGRPETSKSVRSYLRLDEDTDQTSASPLSKPSLHVCHPGICATSIFPLIFPLPYLMFFGFLVARWLGGPWQTLYPAAAAEAPVWIATADPADLAQADRTGQFPSSTSPPSSRQPDPGHDDITNSQLKCKWGSGTTRLGTIRVLPTEVEGWAVRGVPLERPALLASCKPSNTEAQTEAQIESFVNDAADCWDQMERLRMEWDRADKTDLPANGKSKMADGAVAVSSAVESVEAAQARPKAG